MRLPRGHKRDLPAFDGADAHPPPGPRRGRGGRRYSDRLRPRRRRAEWPSTPSIPTASRESGAGSGAAAVPITKLVGSGPVRASRSELFVGSKVLKLAGSEKAVSV